MNTGGCSFVSVCFFYARVSSRGNCVHVSVHTSVCVCSEDESEGVSGLEATRKRERVQPEAG